MLEFLTNHLKNYGVFYVILIVFLVFFSLMMLIWRKIVLSGKKIEYTILRPNGNPIRGKIDPSVKNFREKGATYLVEKEGITHREGVFGHIQTILYFENIPHPIKIENVGKDAFRMKIMKGDTLSEILEHKLVKEFLELHDSGSQNNWVMIVGGIIVFLIIAGIIAFIALKATSGGH